jgi:hypothetical protein
MKTESHIKQELLADLGGHCALPCCHPLWLLLLKWILQRQMWWEDTWGITQFLELLIYYWTLENKKECLVQILSHSFLYFMSRPDGEDLREKICVEGKLA